MRFMFTMAGDNRAGIIKRLFLAFGICGLCSCTTTTTSTVEALRKFSYEHRHETFLRRYMGSKGGYHYIHCTYQIFRIPESQLTIEKPFPLTKDYKKWTALPLP